MNGELLREIAAALNRHSRENESNTPDFVLAQFMFDVLVAFERAVNHRDHWHDVTIAPHFTDAETATQEVEQR